MLIAAIVARYGDAVRVNAEFMRSLPLLTLVRLERWDDVLAEPMPSGDAGVAQPLGN